MGIIMAELFTLFHGNSKKRMYPIMTDILKKCENYRDAREASHVKGWHKIEPADKNSVVWRQKSSTVGGNKCETVVRVGHGRPGYIDKHGFHEHT